MDVLQGTALMAATITMGIGAGVYLLYLAAIMPGLGRTEDKTFVAAFQQIDTAIVGPFLLVFFVGPLVFSAVAAGAHLGDGDRTGLALIAGAIVLQLVMAGITLGVNVPLNDGIKAAGDPNKVDVVAVRDQFDETRWARWNAVRTVLATSAFGLLAWALVIYGGA